MGKDLQVLNSQNKLTLWAGRISECRDSGQRVKDWCREDGICEQTCYRWYAPVVAQTTPDFGVFAKRDISFVILKVLNPYG